jgi:GPH family glycoside/pentoside/hexuronide:cation symporter
MMGSMVLAATVAKPLSARFGKAEISVAANAFAAATCLLLFFWRPQNVWVYVAVTGVCWLGLGLFAMVSWALITDVIDYSEIKHGIREDGTTYALYSFARKLGQAGAAGLTGGLLSLIGYSDATQTAPSVLKGIYNISTLVPALGFALLALVLWFWYPLHKKEVEKNVEYLKQKREKEQEK